MIKLKDLEAYMWGAANLLRGMIDAADFKQYIFPMLFYKRICDVYDEEFQKALEESGGSLEYAEVYEHRFNIPKDFHWRDIRKETKDVGIKFQKALRAIEKANPTLYGIFGDAQWSNKNRFSDAKMIDLIDHFSSVELSLKNVPADEFGIAYEYLIKKFADDSGHTAAEFYTNRTVVQLMTHILDPQPAESIYDPTCGTGGMLLNCVLQLKNSGKEYRNLGLKGQELNLITSAIARMNMIIHDIDDFTIHQGDTIDHPAFFDKEDKLEKFNIILANPPYSVKRWNRKKWLKDPFGRNVWGTPPQGCADYAFIQHIYQSLDEHNGRAAILLPHGVLFRDNEATMRKAMIEADAVDAVIGLGPNLFYNSSMESCILILRTNKPVKHIGKILFINGVKEVRKERSESWLEDNHIEKMLNAYKDYQDIDSFAKVIPKEEVLSNGGNLSIRLYVNPNNDHRKVELTELHNKLKTSSTILQRTIDDLFDQLKEVGIES